MADPRYSGVAFSGFSSANSLVEVRRLRLGSVPFGSAFENRGDDTTSRWERVEPIGVVAAGLPWMVDGSDLRRAPVEGGSEGIESIVAVGVGEVAA